jgi:hypothetical protein
MIMGRSIREQAGFDDDIPADDNKRDPVQHIKSGEDFANRLDALQKQCKDYHEPPTRTDLDLMGQSADWIRHACELIREREGVETESLRDQLGLEDPRAAERRRKQIGEWLRR